MLPITNTTIQYEDKMRWVSVEMGIGTEIQCEQVFGEPVGQIAWLIRVGHVGNCISIQLST